MKNEKMGIYLASAAVVTADVIKSKERRESPRAPDEEAPRIKA